MEPINGFLCKFKQCSKHDIKSIDCDLMLISDDLIMQSLSVTIKYQFLAVVSKQIWENLPMTLIASFYSFGYKIFTTVFVC